MARIALNGLGRIGKLALRRLVDEGALADLVLINEPEGDPAQHALLMEFDSVHGRWSTGVGHKEGALIVAGQRLRLTAERRIENLPLAEMGIDLVIYATGVFKSEVLLAPHLAAGVGHVVVSAPVKDGSALNLVYGVNHHLYDPGAYRIVTAASRTTNCLAPIVKVLHEWIGTRHGSITTMHDVTNTQTLVDRPAKDARRARSALLNLIPTMTGSATTITLMYPGLAGRLNGHAVRVPLLNASLTAYVFAVERPTSMEEVNTLFRAAADGVLAGILGYEERPLVSSDYRGNPRSAIVDALSTMVVNGTQVKVYAWYDNEWGYACRLVDIARMVARAGS